MPGEWADRDGVEPDGEDDGPIIHSCDIPEDAIATSVFEVVGYLTPEGRLRMASRMRADAVGSIVGLAHMALVDHTAASFGYVQAEPDDELEPDD